MTESFPNVIRSEKKEPNVKPGTIFALLSENAINRSELSNENKKVLELCRGIETAIDDLAIHLMPKVSRNMSGELGHINPDELADQIEILQKVEAALGKLRSVVINSGDVALTRVAFLESEQIIEEIRNQSGGHLRAYLNSCLQDISIFKQQSEKR